MRILLTGGSGDLGQFLSPLLIAQGHRPINFDIRPPLAKTNPFFQGTLLKLEDIQTALADVDAVIHIAAWHGIHETMGWKTPQEFWDLNVNGTHTLLQACGNQGVKKMIFISSSSVTKLSGYYGFTKRLAEQAVLHFQHEYDLNAIILRPRAFIPHWNETVYATYLDWVKRFWQGAVHIQDVAQAVIKSLETLERNRNPDQKIFSIDRSPDYPQDEIELWDVRGPGTTFRRHFGKFESLLLKYGLDPGTKPLSLDISEAKAMLGYEPEYGLNELLLDIVKYGAAGPLH